MILRYFNVAGADKNLRTGLISKFSTHLIKIACEVAVGKRKKLIINGDNYDTPDGTPVRDFIHVSDLADIHVLSAENLIKKNKSNIFNCGYGKGFSVKQIINSIIRVSKEKNFKIKIFPRRKGDVPKLVCSNKLAKKLLNWTPKNSYLYKIIKDEITWQKFIK
mgnify:CR=1 FL=1